MAPGDLSQFSAGHPIVRVGALKAVERRAEMLVPVPPPLDAHCTVLIADLLSSRPSSDTGTTDFGNCLTRSNGGQGLILKITPSILLNSGSTSLINPSNAEFGCYFIILFLLLWGEFILRT